VNILTFPTPARIELRGVVVKSSSITGATGVRQVPHEVGRFLYFIEYIEPDGGCIGLWSGLDRAEALAEAKAAAIDFVCRLDDHIAGGHA
jgi:hypothetical protein